MQNGFCPNPNGKNLRPKFYFALKKRLPIVSRDNKTPYCIYFTALKGSQNQNNNHIYLFKFVIYMMPVIAFDEIRKNTYTNKHGFLIIDIVLNN